MIGGPHLLNYQDFVFLAGNASWGQDLNCLAYLAQMLEDIYEKARDSIQKKRILFK